MSRELDNQVALITGGGRGIGRAIAAMFAEAGARVVVTSRSASELDETVAALKAAGGEALAVAADVSDADAVGHVVAEAERVFGSVDVLVNNAGHVGAIGPVWENDPAEWQRCIEVNLVGPFLTSRAVLPAMLNRGGGRIINVSSGAALRGFPFDSSYGASKAALNHFAESLALETRDKGIAVFSVDPGGVQTGMLHHVATSDAGQKWLPRFGTAYETASQPERPAALCLLLASGKADALSGCCLSVSDNIEGLIEDARRIREQGLYTLRLKT